MSVASPVELIRLCKEAIGPILKADGGELYLVRCDAETIALHLAGRCGGCPARTTAIEQIIKPTIRRTAPEVTIEISYGVNLPEGATLL